MRIGTVIGRVTLAEAHPSFRAASLKLAVPLSADELAGKEPAGEAIVVWDPWGAGVDSQIGISEGGEAAQPFRPEMKPVDAYAAALLDSVEVTRLS